MVSVSVRYLFYQPMNEKIKKWTLRFPAKENPNMKEALFDWPIVLQYDFKAIDIDFQKVLGHEVFTPDRSLNQPKVTRVCVRSISVCCFCFVGAFSFQDHRKIALTGGSSPGVLYALPKVH